MRSEREDLRRNSSLIFSEAGEMGSSLSKNPASDSRLLGFLASWLLLFASGLASLVYQVLRVKQLSLMVGVEVQAIMTAVGAFFGGLAVGGYAWGRLADRLGRPLFLYAILEIAVAILAVGASFGLANGPPLFAHLEASIGPFAWLLPFVLVGLPAMLMGGTLPVLMRSFALQAEKFGVAGGRLYAANTSGAVVGALLTSFVLIPALGVRGSSLAAGALNLVAALVAFALACTLRTRSTVRRLPPVSSRPSGFGLALILYAIAGGIALNTTGGIAGTLVTGFILVPAFGLERSLAVLAVAAGLLGSIAVLRWTAVRPALRWATLACGAVTVLAAVFISPDHLARLLASAHGGTLLFHEADPGGTVTVIEQRSAQSRFRRLYVQGISNSGDSLSSLRYMRLQALLPLLIHRGEPRSALVVGLGTGITAGGLLCYPGLDRRVCVELLPAVVRAASQFSGNHGVTADPRITLRLGDGRRELLRNSEGYDLITLEPPPPSNAGVVNLYSRDFYTLAAARLNPDGLVAQWLPLATQSDADTRSLVRSFLDVFPQAALWTTELHEMLLVGSLTPIELEAGRMVARFNQPEVACALREVGIASPAALLATWVTDRAGLERYTGDALPVTDDRPRVEYGSWVMPGEFARSLPQIMALRTDPPLVGADAELRTAVERERTMLLSFYEAGIYAYQGDQGRWQKTMAWVLRRNPDNPYYRWFVGNDNREQPDRKKFP
jgi:spermidine synthase